jgi:hypothetical protein
MVGRFLLAALCLATACAPAHVTGEKRGPSLNIETEIWTFGTVERGETVTGGVRIANAGSDTLHLSLYSTCGCLRATPDRAAIPPGGKYTIEISYMGDEIKSPVTKTVFIDSDDQAAPRLAFKVTGNVTPGEAPHLVAVPDPLAFDVADPTYQVAQLKLSNRGRQALEIGEITCFGCTNTPIQKQLAKGEEAVLEIYPLPEWSENRWLEIKSNDPVQPLKRIAIVELD